MIKRSLAPIALERLRKRPAVAILGARQVGKTTLSMQLVKDLKLPHLRLDLQDPDDLALLVDAKPFLSAHANELVVIDEVQRKPELFPLLRSLIDKDRRTGRFLLLGSSSPAIVQAASESLAGRITYLDLYPFSLHEVGAKHLDRLWLRGGYPDAFLADTDADAFSVLMDILRSFTERDLPALGLRADPANTTQLLRMLTAVHGNVLNMALLGKSMGLSGPTIKTYLRYFEQAYMTFTLPSHHVNVRKRLTRAPKIYITDSGMLHTLSSIRTHDDLFASPDRGHSWEGFAVQQIRAWLDRRAELSYFRTQDGSELDLVITQGTKVKAGIEIKTTNAPTLSFGNQLAFEAVRAPVRLVLTPSAKDHSMGQGIHVCSMASIWKHLENALD
ncbi:MAG TPA: ATP-binding protein [Flavobacteriales bacterium]|jgi:predicted AAA+ superfamily ATPase|nr:ATP-binding protein [Flavobacteriales bacterium]MBK7102101.1 ATP-binding protein [Flavobacteriales bacterium]MBK7620410.1 ATP-binding protein [Flavobacteriales bacterium]MBK8708296.1 ATP-binding protein [Flavobacteriales bacterium]MBK9627648.1 ATP-binding protein [Flavobacteriales bacterium]